MNTERTPEEIEDDHIALYRIARRVLRRAGVDGPTVEREAVSFANSANQLLGNRLAEITE
jgi:hypothetical protein